MCGFYWHSNRIAKKGTDYVLNTAKEHFQSLAENNVVDWKGVREILFDCKKTLDQWYRNMLWHFAKGGPCSRCVFWDDVYQKFLARVDSTLQEEVSDADLLSAAMEMDGTTK